MANNSQLFISPKGKNHKRLAAVEALSLIDAASMLDNALKNGASQGTGLSPSIFLAVISELEAAYRANTLRAGADSLVTENDWDEAEQDVKDTFARLINARDNDLL